MAAKSKTRKRKTGTRGPGRKAAAKPAAKATSKGSADFVCPDCGFVAKHAMGLGRHRSARHGAMSKRAQREAGGGAKSRSSGPARGVAAPPSGWMTRRQAAAAGGIHYNTVRIWERSGLLRTKARGRETLVHEADLRKVLSEKGSKPSGNGAAPAARAAASGPSFEATELLARLDALADGLESLARMVRPRKRRGRPPKR